MSKKKPNLQMQHDTEARARRVCNLRLQVVGMAISERTGKIALKRMIEAGEKGRREASEIGMRKVAERETKSKEPKAGG